MDSKNTDPLGFESLFKTWNQSMQGVMSAIPGFFPGIHTDRNNDTQKTGYRKQDHFTTAFKCWQSLMSAMATPESMNSFMKSAETMPDMAAQFGQALFNSFSELQKKMGRSAASFGESIEAYRFDQLDENMLHVWSDVYEKEFKKYFHIPQLGLTREYQERFNDMIDKLNQFQADQSEFLRLLNLPFQRSATVMQEEIAKRADEGALPEDTGEYYQMWIKILEGHFMTLFQTPEYVTSLSKTISAMSRFSKARDAVFEDMTKSLPIARRSEVDELSKEVYELKKRIRILEKKDQ